MNTINQNQYLPAKERKAYREANTFIDEASGFAIRPDYGQGVGWILEAPKVGQNGELKPLSGGRRRYYGTLEKAQDRLKELVA